ncbi:hypothetical protein [Streptomyces sp. NPDC002990]
MDTGPAIFAVTVSLLFGAAPPLRTGARARRRAPVAGGVRHLVAVPLAPGAAGGSRAPAIRAAARL